MIKSEKGSVTLLVGVTVLLIIIILSSSLMLVSLKRKSQLQESKILQEIYGGDNINEIYQEQLEKKNYSNSGSTYISDITPDLYGKYVDYGIDLNENGIADDWKIFYQDETDRIFIIASDYVGNTNSVIDSCATKAGMINDNSYYKWTTVPNFQVDYKNNRKPLALFRATDYTLTEKNDNSKCVSSLLNTDNWEGLVLSDYADYAIGSPTLEMFIASWNDKGYKKIYYSSGDTDSTGYSIGFAENPSTPHIELNNDSNGYNDILFYPHTSTVDSLVGYRLASPSSRNNSSTYFAHYYGTLHGSEAGYNGGQAGLRPVVCLKIGTGITWDSEKEVFKLTSSPETSPRKYRIAEGTMVKNSLREGPVTLENIGASRVGNISSYTIDEQNGIYVNDESTSIGYWFNYDFVASDGYSTSLNPNHTYYASIECKLSSGYLIFGFNNSFHKGNRVNGVNAIGGAFSKVLDTFSKVSVQGKPSKSAENATYESDYMDSLQFGSGMDYLSKFYIRNLMILDLTEIFGEGNEPTQEWCDANINFDTTIVTK